MTTLFTVLRLLMPTLLLISPASAQIASGAAAPAPTESAATDSDGPRPHFASGSTWPLPSMTISVTGTLVGSHSRVPSPPTQPPNSIGKSASGCSWFLPAGLMVAQRTNPTLFWYHLAADGSVHDASLYQTSGNSDLDKAALACANTAHRQGAIVGGTPSEIDWIGGINWTSPGYFFIDPGPDRMLSEHCVLYYPPEAVRAHAQGNDVIGFRIGNDGNPKNETVVQSSGNRLLDESALRCIASFRYFPAYRNGHPVELDKSARIEWHLIGL